MVSWFYYQRWKNRPDDQNADHLCDQNSKWKMFCQKIQKLRQNDLAKSEDWYNLTFDDCVEQKILECNYDKGVTYLGDSRSQMMFFCGNTVDCAKFNSKKVLNIAKQNVEQIYSVVGILENLNLTLKAFEAYVPKFFKNAEKIFDRHNSNLSVTHTNKNPLKKPLKNSTLEFLKTKFDVEIEFYEFCQQRLHLQVENLNFRQTEDLEDEDSPSFDLQTSDFGLEANDYVLL